MPRGAQPSYLGRFSSSVATLLFVAFSNSVAALELSGLVQGNLIFADAEPSFVNSGTGILRYDDDGLNLSQALLEVTHDLSSSFSASATVNAYGDGDLRFGVTEAFINWKPLSANRIKTKGKVGFFYPRMSAENVDLGWLSPYTYTPSAINSWIGEEIRIAGVEASLFSPGRARRSPWSWELTGAIFGANDPAGSLLSWRGFALHDRQSLHHDRVHFAPYPSVVPPSQISGPPWVEPFHEIDNRLGAYLGAHLRRAGGPDLRFYLYDNNADPLQLNSQRLYAWDTRFLSVAYAQEVLPGLTLLSQWMHGQTDMGDSLVAVDFDSAYLMMSLARGQDRFSLRYEFFEVDEADEYPRDPNNSDGRAWTLSWRRDLNNKLQIGAEYLWTRNTAENRATVGVAPRLTQQQLGLTLQYRFGR